MGIACKKLVYQRSRMSAYLLGWAGIVLAYYYVFLMPSFIVGLALFYGERFSFAPMYAGRAPCAWRRKITHSSVMRVVMQCTWVPVEDLPRVSATTRRISALGE